MKPTDWLILASVAAGIGLLYAGAFWLTAHDEQRCADRGGVLVESGLKMRCIRKEVLLP